MKLRAPNYAEVASTLALVIALSSGTAVAATLINGERIMAGTVKTKQIQDGGVWRRDIKRGAIGTTEVANGTLAYDDLTPGLRRKVDVSPWGKIPSGVTVTGQEYWTVPSGVSAFNIKLPAAAPVPLKSSNLKFAPDSSAASSALNESAACAGTYSRPTSPRGMICLYMGNDAGATNIVPERWADPNLHTKAFSLIVAASATTSPSLTWAYTAP